jgi:hypothetical protein
MRAARSSLLFGAIVEASTHDEAFGVGSVGLRIGLVHTILGSKAVDNLNNCHVRDEGTGWDAASYTHAPGGSWICFYSPEWEH